MRDSIIDALQQKGQSDEQKDGMDMSLIAINTQDSSPKSQIPSSKLQDPESVIARNEAISEPQTSNVFEAQWAGANNPLYIVRNPKNLSGLQDLTGLEEVKPDKQPVAICENIKPFTNHEIQLYKGDIIYLVSDGYEDQFGGTKYKKFMSKQLKELFVNICEKPMSEQKQILETTFINWKGENEQIDDVTILGMKI
ncbi:MAG: hypothetical protein A2046_08350 [Bacteroidetes bacterium GWA2_30_7]|nr:MAG: hypothetical protein A2046_08350 [Bacteroidetes bacterium GWA2_30_7]